MTSRVVLLVRSESLHNVLALGMIGTHSSQFSCISRHEGRVSLLLTLVTHCSLLSDPWPLVTPLLGDISAPCLEASLEYKQTLSQAMESQMSGAPLNRDQRNALRRLDSNGQICPSSRRESCRTSRSLTCAMFWESLDSLETWSPCVTKYLTTCRFLLVMLQVQG